MSNGTSMAVMDDSVYTVASSIYSVVAPVVFFIVIIILLMFFVANILRMELMSQQQLPNGVSWVKTTIQQIPKNAFIGGWENRGKRPVYIGRAEHQGMLITGKVIQYWQGMFLPLLGKEVKNTSFEVLVADNPEVLKWVPASGNLVPRGAVQGGYQMKDPLYIARGLNPAREPTPGKLHPPHGFFLSWGGTEHHRHEYEVLVAGNSKAPTVQQKLPGGAAWVKSDINNIPGNALVGGWEEGGARKVYIGRAELNGSLINGKTIQFWGGTFFPYFGREIKNTSFEVLVADNPDVFKWVPASGGKVPEDAVQGGCQDGDPLYIARGMNPAGQPTPGKLHAPYGFFLSYGGKEYQKQNYEVLVCRRISELKQSETNKLSLTKTMPETISPPLSDSAPESSTKDANPDGSTLPELS